MKLESCLTLYKSLSQVDQSPEYMIWSGKNERIKSKEYTSGYDYNQTVSK